MGRGQIPLKQVWAMLDECASGHTKHQKTHNWQIRFRGKTFYRLPLGPHGRRENPSIAAGEG